MADRPLFTDDGRLRLIDAIGRMTKEGARAEASVLTTFSINFSFYEDVILRLFERAGCRLNVLMVDAQQVAAALADPLRRPRRAGKDYILAPIKAPGAFHPKILALLGEKRPMLAVGSHNATEAGFARNLEATVCWGHDGVSIPSEFMRDAIDFASDWLGHSSGFSQDLIKEISERLNQLCPKAETSTADSEAKFLGWRHGGSSLLEQLRGLVRGQVQKAFVAGPFFDSQYRLIDTIRETWNPQEIIAAVQPDTVTLFEYKIIPPTLKFVDALSLSTMTSGTKTDVKRAPQYLHAKLLALQTTEGMWLAIGSANPSDPAWMQETKGNAEAIVVLFGAAASVAFQKLGLDRLEEARELTSEELEAAALRTRQEIYTPASEQAARHVRTVFVEGVRIPLPGIELEQCRRVVELGEEERPITSAEFFAAPNGSEMTLGEDGAGANLVRVDGDKGPLATIIIHSLATIRAATRPHSAGRILERLGKLEDLDEDLDDLLGLMDRYIFNESTGGEGSRPPPPRPSVTASSQAIDVPFGPRGVSLLSIPKGARKAGSIVEFQLSEIISILIRDLTEAKVKDGDAPDVDIEDLKGTTTEPQPSTETEIPKNAVNWERMVTACRRRIGTMINKLCSRLAQPVPDVDRATWLFGRTLTVLSLIRKLRGCLPPPGMELRKRGRPESLVSADQIRTLFKGSMEALYRPNDGIAHWLETSVDHRLANERATLDALLLWSAREIGADAEAVATFGESEEDRIIRLGDKADAVVSAMSAAAHPDVTPLFLGQVGVSSGWRDAALSAPDWAERHIRFGTALQVSASSGGRLPTKKKSPKAGDLVVWNTEPAFPRVIGATSGDKVILLGLGDTRGKQTVKLKQTAIQAVDVGVLLPAI